VSLPRRRSRSLPRDLGWPAKALDAARATLEEHGDRVNAAYAKYLQVRRLLLIGRLNEAERMLAELDLAPFPPASRAALELVVAGIAIRRLRTETARAALARAGRAARHTGIPALGHWTRLQQQVRYSRSVAGELVVG
jgi:hypothetical protein